MADFVLGRLKFKWRGDWGTSTAYLIDDIVKYGGNTYVCVTNHTSSSTTAGFYTDLDTSSYWQLHTEGIFFKGDWTATTFYKRNDLVKYGAYQYRAIGEHTSQSLFSLRDVDSTIVWQVFSEGLQWEDTYNPSVTYQDGDVVSYGGYTYVYVNSAPSTGNTPTDNVYWDVITTGFNNTGEYSHGTSYKTGDVVKYGGNSYVATVNHTNYYPANTDGSTNSSYWDLLVKGLDFQSGGYSSATTYNIGDVVRFESSSFVLIKDRVTNVEPGTDATTWQLVAQGSETAVLTNRGDMIIQGASDAARLPIGISGSVLTTDGVDPIWSNAEGKNVYYVANSGSDSANDGSQYRPFKTINYALTQASSGDVVDFDTVTGGTGGTPGTYDISQTGTTGSGTGCQIRVILDGSSTPTVEITNGGSGHVAGDVITFANIASDGSTVQLAGATSITITVVSASIGDVIYVKNGVYRENLPLSIPRGVTVQGESLRGTEIRPNTGTGSQASGITFSSTIDGATDGTQNYLHPTTATGSGNGIVVSVTISSGVVSGVELYNGGFGYAVGDTVTLTDTELGGVAGRTLTITIDTVQFNNASNMFLLNNSTNLVQMSMRGLTGVPTAKSNFIESVNNIAGGTGGTPGTYVEVGSTGGSGTGAQATVTTDGSSTPTVTITEGGTGYVAGEQITFVGGDFGGGTNITCDVAVVRTRTADGTGKAAVCSLDPSGAITSVSPYVQNCTSFNTNATGIQIDGNIHSSGNKSILANDFTQINSDGRGVHALAGGRGEMVSVFTYYCDKSFFAESGGFIRGLNCSSAYGETGAEANGTLATETPVSVVSRGEILKYNTTTFVGAATETDISDVVTTSGTPTAATIVGQTSGASATVFRTNISLDYIHIENRTGNFTQGETVTITKDDSSTFEVDLDSTLGDSTAAQVGQIGPLIAIDSSDGTLGVTGVITIGSNIQFSGNSKYYRVSAVSETNTVNETALVRLTESVITDDAVADNTATDVTVNFSNVRLTGHDFLDIGSGGFADTNYPGTPTQPPSQDDEVQEISGGRVYFTSTDQKGDFRVGDLFRIEQATGVATLNADAFDLSGLSELQLGAIGAELGATINEFSTDQTLSGDSNSAVPTERAVKGYFIRDNAGTGAWVPPTGTTAERPTGGDLYTGAFRYNSSLVTWEGYNGTQWTGLGGGNPWATTSTSTTVAANDRYFVNTSGGAITLTLPSSPQVGDQVRFIDLASTFDTNNLTVGRNGNNINGTAADLVVSTEDSAFGLVYSGATYGWKLIEVL